MTPAALETLQKIGRQLDSNIYPAVHNGGIVMPCDTVVPQTKGEVNRHERQRWRRSKNRPREGIAGGQGTPCETPSLVVPDLQTQYETELDAVYEAYPKTRVWNQPDGMVLLVESAVLNGLDRTALFLVAIPYAKHSVVKGWGFWGTSIIGVEWIGPRHTNFPDGSICAFEPRDGTWNIGGPLIELLDLYSLWALRHLHMATLSRWPGHQAIHFPYERILELRPDEHCGCQHSDRLYGDCCQKNDLQRNIVADAINFIARCHGGHRNPPAIVTEFVLKRSNVPLIPQLFGS